MYSGNKNKVKNTDKNLKDNFNALINEHLDVYLENTFKALFQNLDQLTKDQKTFLFALIRNAGELEFNKYHQFVTGTYKNETVQGLLLHYGRMAKGLLTDKDMLIIHLTQRYMENGGPIGERNHLSFLQDSNNLIKKQTGIWTTRYLKNIEHTEKPSVYPKK